MVNKKVLKTRLCEMLNIEYPILLAGMGMCSGPTLAAAISNAGGLGVLGATGLSPDEVRGWIKKTKSLTDKPFGLDLILPHEISSSMSLPKNIKEILPLWLWARTACGLARLFWPPKRPVLTQLRTGRRL